MPYLQRDDWQRLRSGKTNKKYDRKLPGIPEADLESGETPARKAAPSTEMQFQKK